MNQSNHTYEDILEQDGILVYKTVGCSMLPLIRQNRDVIVIAKRPEGRLKKYDVALYKRGNQYILHRVVKVLPDGYVIIGDHQCNKEYDIKDAHIIGVLESLIRNDKEITMDNRKYRLYVHLWCGCLPVRFFILKIGGLWTSFKNRLAQLKRRKDHE